MTTAITCFEYQPRMIVQTPGNAIALIAAFRDELVAVVPDGARQEVAIILDSASQVISQSDSLLRCTQESIIEAVKEGCLLGLPFHKSLNMAHLVPFKGRAQFIPGYQGLRHLARQATGCEIDAEVVYEGDVFEPTLGDTQTVRHVPCMTAPRTPQKVVAAYMVAVTPTTGWRKVELMSRAEILAIQARSRAGRDGPWVTDWVEMARKTVLRRGCKHLPKSIQECSSLLDRALAAEDRVTGRAARIDGSAEGADKTAALRERLAGRKPEQLPAPEAPPPPPPQPDPARPAASLSPAPAPAKPAQTPAQRVAALVRGQYPDVPATRMADAVCDLASRVSGGKVQPTMFRDREAWTDELADRCAVMLAEWREASAPAPPEWLGRPASDPAPQVDPEPAGDQPPTGMA